MGEGLLPVSQKLGSSLLRQASERQISSLRWAPGAAFRNPWKPDLPCLSGFLLVTLSWVGSHVPAPGSYGERLTREACWSPATRASEKDRDRALTPAVEVVHVPPLLASPGSLQAKQLCAFTLNSHWGRAATGQKKVSMHTGSFCSCPTLCAPVDCVLPGLSVRGSPGKNTGVSWPILVATPFQSTVFPAALATNSPEYQVLPEPLRPKQLQHLHSWPSPGQPKSSRVASGANPSGWPTGRGEEKKKKHSWNPGGSVAKEDPKLSHQLHKLRIKCTWSTRPTLPMHSIKGHWEHPLRKMQSFWELWTFKARTHKRRTRFKSEQIPHLVQRSA